LQYPGLQHLQLSSKSCNTFARHIGKPLIARIGNDTEQLFNTPSSDRCDNAELGKMGADRVDHGGLLADEEMAGAVKHQPALLLGLLSRNEPHVCPSDRFADRLGVSRIVLVSLDVWLHVGWRHQPHGVAERLELTRPVM